MAFEKNNKLQQHEGGCLCGETTYVAEGKYTNPHLCSCKMCQKSSGAPTVAWVEFPLDKFQWNGKREPGVYQSSQKIKRCYCKNCGGALATFEEGREYVDITICSLNDPNLIVPNENKHSYKASKPAWWELKILRLGTD